MLVEHHTEAKQRPQALAGFEPTTSLGLAAMLDRYHRCFPEVKKGTKVKFPKDRYTTRHVHPSKNISFNMFLSTRFAGQIAIHVQLCLRVVGQKEPVLRDWSPFVGGFKGKRNILGEHHHFGFPQKALTAPQQV